MEDTEGILEQNFAQMPPPEAKKKKKRQNYKKKQADQPQPASEPAQANFSSSKDDPPTFDLQPLNQPSYLEDEPITPNLPGGANDDPLDNPPSTSKRQSQEESQRRLQEKHREL